MRLARSAARARRRRFGGGARADRTGPALHREQRRTIVRPRVVLARARSWHESLDALRAAIQLDPGHRLANHGLGQALLALGRAKEAAGVLDAAAQNPNADAETFRLLATAQRQAARPEQALRAIERAAALGSPRAYVELGDIFEQLKDHANAADAYRRALPADSGDATLHFRLGNALVLAGRTDEALDVFQRAAGSFPSEAKIRLSLGALYAQRRRIPEASAEWQALARLDSALADQLAKLISTS